MGAAVNVHLTTPPPGGIVRVGPLPDPFVWRDSHELSEDDPASMLLGGSRFDAPHAEFRTTYYASDAYGAFLETLAPLREVIDLEANLADFFDDAPDAGADYPLPAGTVPADRYRDKALGTVKVATGARFVDLEHANTLAFLNQRLGRGFLEPFGLDRFDRGVPLHRNRRVTRALALAVWELVGTSAAGLHWTSVHASGVECWALWEHAVEHLHDHGVAPIDFSNTALRDAADTLKLDVPAPPPPPLPEGMPDTW